MNSYKRFAIIALIITVTLSTFLVGRRAFTQSQPITNGINYLKTTQNADGSWGGTPTSLNGIFPTTAAALEALRTLEATASTNQTSAAQFLSSQMVEENPYLAARTVSLAGTSSNTAADVNTLLARQNLDGGWGTAEGFESDALDTSLALMAIRAASASSTSVTISALNYLTSRQNADGGWALTQGEESHVFYTAVALQALDSCRLQFSLSVNQTRAITFLRSRQNGNGGYGNPSGTAFETAAVLLAILGSGQPLLPAEPAALNFLSSTQQANGSWVNDPYSTALALRALAISRDSDADGMSDDYEIANGLNPNDASDAAGDNDLDGLANLEESRRGTNANNRDTDGDGVDDFTEIANGSDPRDSASHNRPPVISSQPNTAASDVQPYSYQVQASDPDGDSLSFSLLQSPTGMTISIAGLIAWTPAPGQPGPSTVIVRVSDGRGGYTLQQYRVSVLARGIDFAVASVDARSVDTDTQTLVIGGTVHVEIQNLGGNLFAGSFAALLFEDRNNNGTYESTADNPLGRATFAGSITSNGVTPLEVPVSGVVLFRDNAIYALVDSANQIPELNETNNTGSSGRSSRYQPPVNQFKAKVKWVHDPADGLNVQMSPFVAPLQDTNHDDAINERDIPAVIYRSTFGLRALSGDTGALLWEFREGSGVFFTPEQNPAVGDLDGDDVPEILVPASGGFIYCFTNEGRLLWTSTQLNATASPTIVDLDGDGHAEILSGPVVFNFDGTIRRATRTPDYTGGSIARGAQAADLDLDGVPEIIAGSAAFDRNGNTIWWWQAQGGGPYTVVGTLDRGATTVILPNSSFVVGDGYTAIANLDDDPNPEVIVVYDGGFASTGTFDDYLWVFEHDGRIKTGFPVGLYQISNGLSFNPGPPTVADFDGDGEPEIAISVGRTLTTTTSTDTSQSMMAVYERDGRLKWLRTMLTVDRALSHGSSPAAAFDFDGDGAAEIVYQTAQKLIILNGRDGATLYEIGVGRNAITASVTPAIVDVDNDGIAEIVVVGTNIGDGSPLRSGVLVLGDTSGNWRNARRVWNQWFYHVTNVEEDAGIPQRAANNWTTLNSSRAQIHADRVEGTAAPDLTVSKVTINTQNCPASVDITARIGNGGSLHVAAGQRVNFYSGDPAAGGTLIGTQETKCPLPPHPRYPDRRCGLYPGEFEDVTLRNVSPPSSQVFVTVNDRPVETRTESPNLALLPHTWAQASSYCPGCTIQSNNQVHLGIDGVVSPSFLWRQNFGDAIPTNPPFYEVRFQFPVNPTSVIVENDGANNAGFLTGTLDFSNGFSTPFAFDATTGEGTITFPEQPNVSWIRLTGATTRPLGPSVSEFIVPGFYTEPQFRINEGEGRLGNNKAASGPGAPTCNPATNQPPVITSAPIITAGIGTAYSYQVQASDPNADPLVFLLASGPGGMTMNGSGLINWTPASTQTGDFPASVLVSDGRGGSDQQSFVINVGSSSGSNRSPQITSTPAVSVALGQAYQYDVNASDPDDDVVLFSLLGPPAGAAIDLFTGLITWTPSQSQVGTQYFAVEAQDGRGGRSIQSFAVEVRQSATTLPPSPQDRDGDGFDETVDCNDTNPNVNPGRTEIPANGVDEDCNPSTPDALPPNSATCSIASDQRSYNSNSLAQFTVRVRNLSSTFDIVGLQAHVTVSDSGGLSVFATSLPVGALSASGQFRSTLVFSTQTRTPGNYRVTVELRLGANVVCSSQIWFALLSSATQGKALVGSVTANPAQIVSGGTSMINYQIRNAGNADISGVSLKILVVEARTGMIAQSFDDQTSLARGQSFSNTRTFNSAGAKAGDHIVILHSKIGNVGETLSSTVLNILAPANRPPDTSQARPSVATLWPPNHNPVPVSILGLTDPDGDQFTVRIDRIMQDEPTNAAGDGNACPDALGVGGSIAQLRAERSGTGNGRVYTIFFTATDKRGGSSQASVKVCVPKNQNDPCVDEGPLFNSSVCP